MLSPDTIRWSLVILLALPILTGVLMLFFRKSDSGARSLAIFSSLVHLVLTGLVVLSASGTLSSRSVEKLPPGEKHWVFSPEFVPGDPMRKDGSNLVDTHTSGWVIAKLPMQNVYADKLYNPDSPSKMPGVRFFIGLDGLNLWLLALSSVMMFSVVLLSMDTVKERLAAYFGWLFVLQGCVIGVFLSFDLILFYVFFELTLIPLYFLIGNWGPGPTRREAARKLFLFTLAGGLITLLGIANVVLTVYSETWKSSPDQTGVLSFSIPELSAQIQQQLAMAKNDPEKWNFWKNKEWVLFFTLIVGFAVKIPLIPVHTWLPGAYTQAPIGVTVMLSALLAKMGTFGLLRVCMPLAPDAALSYGLPVIGVLAAIGIIYAALCAYAQSDFRGLVAYSSISHLGFCVLGLLAFNPTGMSGGTLHMVNHGLSTGALFILVGYLAQRYTSGQISDFSGLWGKLPVLTFFMIVLALASVGLPGLNNFVSEMLMLSSLFDLKNARIETFALAIAAAVGIFLGAWYTITLLYRAFFGPLREPLALPPEGVKDLRGRELLAVVPLTLLCLVLGIFSQPVLDTMKPDVDRLTRIGKEARERQVKPPTPLSVEPK
jgi:NADH-quinone oxidoreductase subunit M